jgi:hypothetical protein
VERRAGRSDGDRDEGEESDERRGTARGRTGAGEGEVLGAQVRAAGCGGGVRLRGAARGTGPVRSSRARR